MTDIVFTAAHISFWSRVRKRVFTAALVVALTMLTLSFSPAGELQLFWLAVVAVIGIISVLVILENARIIVNEIRITDDKIIVAGYNYNSPWEEELDLTATEVTIAVKKGTMGIMTCSLKIVSSGRAVYVDGLWDYRTQSTIFREFKRAKGERITSQEEHVLARMERTDDEPTLWDQFSGNGSGR